MVLFVPITSDNIPGLRESGVSDDAIQGVLIRVAQRYTPILQKSAPVDTGRLKRSLRVELLPDDSGVALTSQVFYAGFVEYGTRRMRPRQYAESIVPDLISYMNDLLSELGAVTRQPIRAVDVGEQSGDVSAKVSESFLASIRVGRLTVPSLRVNPIRVPPESIQQLGITPESVQ